jgi:hypothetical protein
MSRKRSLAISLLVAATLVGFAPVAFVAVTRASAGVGVTAAKPRPNDRERLAQLLLDHQAGAALSSPARVRALRQTAGIDQAGHSQQPFPNASEQRAGNRREGRDDPPRGFANVRVNDPSLDTHQTDQTTQSETSIAVVGRNVAVGFNDSQQALTVLTGGTNLSGYAYSNDGGASFTDGGTIPNPENFVNLGDPWLASDRSGAMYYSTLTYGGNVGNLEIGVAKSTDGGRTWAPPRFASPHRDDLFYSGDKDALTVGPNPTSPTTDVLYATWSDTSCNPATFACTNGLAVSRSTDGGETWTIAYADTVTADLSSCSFTGYTGAQPLVTPTGVLYVAAEKIIVDDPNCTFDQPTQLSEVVFRSTDGGQSFEPGITVSNVTPASPSGALVLGPGQFIRTAEFPTLALNGDTLSLAWNDGEDGHSHIKLAQSSNDAQTWTVTNVTSGNNDEIQPALSADRSGLHLLYYQRNPDNTLDVVLANSRNRASFRTNAFNRTSFRTRRVSSISFPGVETVPQFDPQIGFGYMGDYIANVSDGTTQYFAWGDNRNMITDFTYPAGRHDPDVFFAHT